MNTTEVKISESERILDFKKNMFTFGMLCQGAHVSPNTVRTWLKRYFQHMGVKQEKGYILYSGFDLATIRVFEDLVKKLAMRPETAATVAKSGIDHLTKLADTESFTSQESVYFVVTNANKIGADCKIIKNSEFDSYFKGKILDPYVIIPFAFSVFMIQEQLYVLKGKDNMGKRDRKRLVLKIKILENENDRLSRKLTQLDKSEKR